DDPLALDEHAITIEDHQHSFFRGHRQAPGTGRLRNDRRPRAFIFPRASPSPEITSIRSPTSQSKVTGIHSSEGIAKPSRRVAYVPIESHQRSFLGAYRQAPRGRWLTCQSKVTSIRSSKRIRAYTRAGDIRGGQRLPF